MSATVNMVAPAGAVRIQQKPCSASAAAKSPVALGRSRVPIQLQKNQALQTRLAPCQRFPCVRASAKPHKDRKETESPAAEETEDETKKSDIRPPEDGPRSSANPIIKFLSLLKARWQRVFGSLGGVFIRIFSSSRAVTLLAAGLLFMGMGAASMLGSSQRATRAAMAPKEVLYSDFLTMVKSESVGNAVIDDSGNRVFFSLRPDGSNQKAVTDLSKLDHTSMTAPAALRKDSVTYPFYTMPVKNTGVASTLMDGNVSFTASRSTWSSAVSKVLVTMLMLWVPMLPLMFLLRRMMDSRTGGSRKKSASNKSPNAPSITFADVAGVDVAKMELLETVACLKDASRYKKLNAKMPSGVLLSGPPGTGKTLLAKAVAGEAGVPFFAASASEFVELFVGRGAARVRELFAEARKRAPCVVFIDELDAVGMKRGFGNNEERDQTLNQLLTELDGFEGRDGILLLAATNRPEALDPALLRPGRLSRKVVVPVPDEPGRREILGIHMRGVPLDEAMNRDEAIAVTARLSAGFSGAELANVVNEAALLAARKGGDFVTLRELMEGVSRTRYGVNQPPAPGSFGARFQDFMMGLSQPPKVTSGQQLTG